METYFCLDHTAQSQNILVFNIIWVKNSIVSYFHSSLPANFKNEIG